MELLVKSSMFLAMVTQSAPTVLPTSCVAGDYFDPGKMKCQSCPGNASMITSIDGFGCSCEDHSVLTSPGRCKTCNATEMISSDRTACVPRRCQISSGKVICRKCPNNHISVTQNNDGSPTKEVVCVKCARGYKVEDNTRRCVRCEGCSCAKNEVVVRGRCLPKRYVNERPRYEETKLHPITLLDIVKNEYLCTQNDHRACRAVANACVRNFYTTELAGPCRLWLQSKIFSNTTLPELVETTNDQISGEIMLNHGKESITVIVAVHTADGGLKIYDVSKEKPYSCFLPIEITFGHDMLFDCLVDTSNLPSSYYNDTLVPYLYIDGELREIPLRLRRPEGYYVQKGKWSSNRFKRYFVIDESLPITTNVTNTIYLKSLLIRLQIEREKLNKLKALVSIEVQYDTKMSSNVISTRLHVKHEMPNAGVLRGLEIWGGVLGALLALYAVVQWRGVIRRGGLQISLVPLMCGAIADALYFAALFSTLHTLALELTAYYGIVLPPSYSEQSIIKAFIYSAFSLKVIKVVWFNWNQCRCDLFFLDWSEFYSPNKEVHDDRQNFWRARTLAREWFTMQTKRKVPLGFTVTITLILLQVMRSWQNYLQNIIYQWSTSSIVWWLSYTIVLLFRWIHDKVFQPPPCNIPKICAGVGISLIVFQEELYAHYVHGRYDDSDQRLSGQLSTCRVACAPQLRAVYKQLTMNRFGELDTKRVLLSKFLAAFFERALDGLNWVASERTVLERLLDVEIIVREAGNTSILLFDDDVTPSCFGLTWWGEEWSLATFDAMLFGAIFAISRDYLLAILVCLIVWQIMKQIRAFFGMKNQKEKTGCELT